jgi:hypothetical protein
MQTTNRGLRLYVQKMKLKPPKGYAGGGPIQPLKKSTRGTFTASAKKAGSSVQGFASKVLSAPKGQYSPLQRKRANFARNAAGWKH